MNEAGQEVVLVVDDDEGTAYLQSHVLQRAGYATLTAGSESAALGHIASARVDLIVLDYRLPGERTGLDWHAELKAAGWNIPVVMVTGFGDESTVIKALRAGVADFVTKSSEYLEYLPVAVSRVLNQSRLARQLAETEVRFQSFMDNSPAVCFIKDDQGRIIYGNKRFADIFEGVEWQGKTDFDLFPHDIAKQFHDNDLRVLDTGQSSEFFETTLAADGSISHWISYRFPVPAINAQLLGGVVLDITDRTRAQQALVESEAKFRSVTESAGDAVLASDADGRILSWNPGATRIFGRDASSMIGESLHCLWPEGVRQQQRLAYEQHIQAYQEGTSLELLGLGESGREFPIELSVGTWETGSKVFHSIIIRDISERKRAEEALRERDQQLRQSQKMEAIGTLAGGVAHEFNNLLQAIQGYTRYAMEGLEPSDQRYQDLQQVINASQRATSLTKQLLGFGRREALDPVDIDPNALIRDLVKMLQPLIGEHIQVNLRLDPQVGSVHADMSHMQQLIMNLCVNARDAMPAGGELLIRTENLVLTEPYCELHPDVDHGLYMVLTVADTGCGIAPENKEHIFEPFFTTKEIGKGTGLGLAMVYGIVRQHGGAIRVYSELGQGTTFRIYLPVVNRPVAAANLATRTSPLGGSETILIAEDDPMVRSLAVRVLKIAGYQPMTAADGAEAVTLFEQHSESIDLLLFDVVMPQLSGRDAYEKIKAIKPSIPAVFCSGYDPETAQVGFVMQDNLKLIQKPFDPDVLLGAIREVLDAQLCPSS